jgi:hypothetical protein
MTKKYSSEQKLGPKALEMVMRDVLGGMEELAVMKSFESMGGVFEVVSIEPDHEYKAKKDSSDHLHNDEPAEVISIYEYRKKAHTAA